MTGGKISGALVVVAAAALLSACSDDNSDDSSNTPSTMPSVPPSMPSSMPSSMSMSAPAPGGASSAPPKALPKVFDNAKMQDAVHQILTDSYRIKNVGVVTCPPNKPVKKGTTFDCKAKVGKKNETVAIKVTSADGHYDVSKPRPK